jgi:hypothetical protein
LNYVGKATNLKSRLAEYLRNVSKIESGKPYRKGNPDGFRRIHLALASAKKSGRTAKWEVLEFTDAGNLLLEAERRWIVTISPKLNGRAIGVEGLACDN